MIPVLIIIVLGGAVLYLYIKNRLLKRGLEEIASELSELLKEDTNVLISLSSGDPSLRKFAAEMNRELRELKKLRRNASKMGYAMKRTMPSRVGSRNTYHTGDDRSLCTWVCLSLRVTSISSFQGRRFSL